MKKILLSLFTIVIALSLNAQFIENFSYTASGTPANDTLNANPTVVPSGIWVKHSGTSFGPLFVAAGLTYAGYAGSGVGGAASVTNITRTGDINAAVGPYTADSVYCSFILNVTAAYGATGDYNIHLGGTTGTSVTDLKCRIFIKDGATPGTNVKIGISKAGTGATIGYSTEDYPLNTPILVVIKYKIIAGAGNDIASAFIFTSGVPATEPALATITALDPTGTDIASVASVCLRQGTVAGSGSCTVDGIRIGTRWNDAPLPVKLASFSAIGLQKQVNLNWLTVSETGAANFNVERSFDGTNFETAGTVVAKGNSGLNNNYQFTDNNLTASTIYYRLKTVSTDGRFEYSTIQKVTLRNIKLNVGPNPSANEILINASSAIDMVQVFDMNGKLKASKNGNKSNSLRIGIAAFANGSYIIKTTVEGVVETKTIVVKH